MSGVKLEVGSIQESIAIVSHNKKAEIEFLKTMAIINAIISVGNGVIAAVSGSEHKGSDALNKCLDSLKDMMLPHYAEERNLKAKRMEKMLKAEINKGPLKIQIMTTKRARKK